MLNGIAHWMPSKTYALRPRSRYGEVSKPDASMQASIGMKVPLCANDWSVVGLCQPGTSRTYIDRLPVQVVEGDITDKAVLEQVVPDNMDAVFHTAAMTSIWSRYNDLQTRVNVTGTRNLARVALAKGAKRLVHTSTWNTFGTGQAAISEETPQTGGLSWVNYVRTKYLAEEEIRATIQDGLFAVILNPGHLLGRYDQHNWARMIRMATVPVGISSSAAISW